MPLSYHIQKFTNQINAKLNPRNSMRYGIVLLIVDEEGRAEFGTNLEHGVLLRILEDHATALRAGGVTTVQ